MADGLRVDVMTSLREVPPFAELWARRTTIEDQGEVFEVLAIEDLVRAKKTQRSRDWPVIDALVEGHCLFFHAEPTAERIAFWLNEARSPERLLVLATRFPAATDTHTAHRPLLRLAVSNETDALRAALDTEVRAEQARDRAYWAPLKAELEAFRRAECGEG